MVTEINIARDFSKVPVGRFRTDGPNSGQRFREDFLIPGLEKGDVVVILDGTEGYPSSFIEEAFGGLLTAGQWSSDYLRKHLSIRATGLEYVPYRERILSYLGSKR